MAYPDGIPQLEPDGWATIERNTRAEAFAAVTGAVIRHGRDYAFYNPGVNRRAILTPRWSGPLVPDRIRPLI